MDNEKVLSIYDEGYALTYDERFLHGEPWKNVLSQYMEEVLREVIPPGGSWLDVCCGTGWYLSRFPDVERAGFDLSRAMLEFAARRNPHVPLIQGSFFDDKAEWNGRWELVTNLWYAYQYVSSMADVEDVMARHASWVSPTGTLLVHVGDSDDVCHTSVPWESSRNGGALFVTAVIWSWREPDGTRHDNLVAPQLQQMVNTVARHFENIEVRWWPRVGVAPRFKAVVGRKKRRQPFTSLEVGDNYPFTNVYPPPDHPLEEEEFDRRAKEEALRQALVLAAKNGSKSELSAVGTGNLLRELAHRTGSGRLFSAAARRLIRSLTRR